MVPTKHSHFSRSLLVRPGVTNETFQVITASTSHFCQFIAVDVAGFNEVFPPDEDL